MVELEKPNRISLTIYNEDLNLLDNINKINRSEGLRYIFKEYKRMKQQEKSLKPVLMIIIGVLMLVIASFISLASLPGLFLTTLGFCFLGMTFYQIYVWKKGGSSF